MFTESIFVLETIISVILCNTDISFVRFVKTCPTTGNEWRTRAYQSVCSYHRYHCFIVNGTALAEVCMLPGTVNSEFGCPMIVGTKESLALIFIQCNDHTQECPASKDTYYRTDEWYKYEPCFSRKTYYQTQEKETYQRKGITDGKTFPTTPMCTGSPVSTHWKGQSTLGKIPSTTGTLQHKENSVQSLSTLLGTSLVIILLLWASLFIVLCNKLRRIKSALLVLSEDEPTMLPECVNRDSSTYDTIDNVDMDAETVL